MTPIKFSGKITYQIFKRAQLVHLGWKKYILIIIPVLFVISYLLNAKPPYTFESILPSLGGLIIIPILILTTLSSWKKVFKNTPAFQREFIGSIDDSNYAVSSSHGTSTLPWSEFTNATITNQLILLYQSPIQFQLLAPEMFGSPEEWGTTCELIRRAVSKRS